MDIQQIKIKNMESERGNSIPNQFIIRVKTNTKDQVGFDSVYFQSYNSIIACRDYKGNTVLDENYWDYSRTTGKYRNLFLSENKVETQRKIRLGVYKLADLNK
jgi:hypothetical protein